MLQTSKKIIELIEAGDIAPFLLARIDFTTPLLVTDHSTDVLHDIGTNLGPELYSSDISLVSISPPNALVDVSRDLFNIVFEDADGSLKAVLDSQNIGTRVLVTMGFLEMPEATMSTERLVIYRGLISSVNWSVDEDSSIVNLRCSGPMAKLLQVTNRTTSDASQRKINPLDSCFQYTHATSDEKTLNWGDATS